MTTTTPSPLCRACGSSRWKYRTNGKGRQCMDCEARRARIRSRRRQGRTPVYEEAGIPPCRKCGGTDFTLLTRWRAGGEKYLGRTCATCFRLRKRRQMARWRARQSPAARRARENDLARLRRWYAERRAG